MGSVIIVRKYRGSAELGLTVQLCTRQSLSRLWHTFTGRGIKVKLKVSLAVIFLWTLVFGVHLCLPRVYKAIETYLGSFSCGSISITRTLLSFNHYCHGWERTTTGQLFPVVASVTPWVVVWTVSLGVLPTAGLLSEPLRHDVTKPSSECQS